MKKKMIVASLVGIGLTLATAAHAAEVDKLDQRIAAAHDVLHELMATPDKGVPLDIAAKAHCVAVIPGYKRGHFWSVHNMARVWRHAVPELVGALPYLSS